MQRVLAPVIGPSKEIHDLTGRVAVVTGGATGIGFEISRAFAHEGCRVIMINRKEEQGNEAIEKIKKEKSDAKIEWRPCDLGNLKEVREVFSDIRENEERLDLFICSAGLNTNQFGLDADGIDRHFGINWLGHYYALNQVFPLIRKTSQRPSTPAPRIIMESSEVHKIAPFKLHFASFDEINDPNLDSTVYYGRTKLAMILGTRFGLVDRVIKPNGDNIYAISVHPGDVATDMQDQWRDAYPGITGKLLRLANLSISRSPEQGSYSALYAATSPEIEEKNWNGVYLTDPGKEGSVSSQGSDPNLGAALWDLSARFVRDKLGDDALLSWDKQ